MDMTPALVSNRKLQALHRALAALFAVRGLAVTSGDEELQCRVHKFAVKVSKQSVSEHRWGYLGEESGCGGHTQAQQAKSNLRVHMLYSECSALDVQEGLGGKSLHAHEVI